jgi:hypothetical protein
MVAVGLFACELLEASLKENTNWSWLCQGGIGPGLILNHPDSIMPNIKNLGYPDWLSSAKGYKKISLLGP